MNKKVEVIVVKPDHMLWNSFDDDDWNGHTCSMWIGNLNGFHVRLHPPQDCSQDLLSRICKSIGAVARSVKVC